MLNQNGFEIITAKQRKKIECRILKSTKVKIFTYSFAFNANTTILFTGGSGGKIRIYGFNVRQKLIQNLTYHTQIVGCLIFLKKTQSLISGSEDKTIKIWNQDKNKQWNPQKILQGHFSHPQCIIANEDEDLLISGGLDKKIIFLKKENLCWSCQQEINISTSQCCLSLSPSQKTLISCGENIIRVIQLQPDQKWVITQIIYIDQWGYRLCFITDNQFAFQPFKKGLLQIFNYQQETKQFIQAKKVKIQYCDDCTHYFPAQFINQRNTLIIKHGHKVNLFQSIQNKEFALQQQITFNCYAATYGRATDDGQYLVTWDYGSNKIQVRKLLFLV